jgi:hypothetical protein
VAAVGATVPKEPCVFSFEPGVLLVDNRPGTPTSQPLVVDPYGMAMVAVTGAHDMEPVLRERLATCEWVLTVGPGFDATRLWVDTTLPTTHVEVAPGIWHKRPDH